MNSLIITIGLALCGSGCAPDHNPVVSIPSDFQAQVSAFQIASASLNGGTPIQINDLIVEYANLINTTEEDGECDTGTNQTPIVKIDQETWSYLDDVGKETLMFHELGHCVLGRVHNPATVACPNEGQLSGTCPSSIMTPSTIIFEYDYEDYYTANRQAYIQELFLQGSGPATVARTGAPSQPAP